MVKFLKLVQWHIQVDEVVAGLDHGLVGPGFDETGFDMFVICFRTETVCQVV